MKKFLAILLAVMMLLSTVSFAAPTMAPTVESTEEATTQEPVSDETAEDASLASDSEWTHEVYGDLLYEVNFETGVDYALSSKISNYGKVNPNYAGSDTWTQSIGSYDDKGGTIVTAADGKNHYLTFKNGTSKWPQFQTNASKTFAGVGYYTVMADVMYNQPGTSGANFSMYNFNCRYEYYLAGDTKAYRDGNNGSQAGCGSVNSDNVEGGTWVDNEWRTAVGKTSYTKVNPEGSSVTGLYQILHTFNMAASATTKSVDTFAIDNVKMYYKPFNAEVKVLGGVNTVAGDQVISIPLKADEDNVFTKSEIMACVADHGDMILTDLTLEDGSAFESINVLEVATLKAVWEEYDKTYLSLDFNNEEEFKQLLFMGQGQVDSNPTTTTVEGNVTGSGYSTNNSLINNGTYATIKYGVKDASGNPVDTGIYDSNWTLQPVSGGTSCKASIADVGAIQMRFRLRNARLSNGSYVYRSSATKNTNATYTPNLQFDLFFSLDEGDGVTFPGLSSSRQKKVYGSVPMANIADKWVTMYFDLTTLTGKQYDATNKKFLDGTSVEYWNNASFLKTLRIDPTDGLWAGTEFDIDYIHFIERDDLVEYNAEVYFLNGEDKDMITGNMSDVDYRYNSVLCFDFDKDLGLTADEFYAQLVTLGFTDGVYNAAAEYDEENFIYTLYAGKSLVGKTVTFPNAIVKTEDGRVKIDTEANGKTVKFAAKKAFDDGENLIPNGDFSVPYYNSFDIAHTGAFETAINSNDTRMEVTFLEATFNGFQTVRNNAIQFKPNTNYYVQAEVVFKGIKNSEGVFDDSYTLNYTNLNFWMPKDDGKYGMNGSYWGMAEDYSYIEDGVVDTGAKYGNFTLRTENIDLVQPRKRVFKLTDTEVSSSYISFQADLRGACPSGSAMLTKKAEDGTVTTLLSNVDGNIPEAERPNAAGITYYVNHLIVKEMFDINFVLADGTVVETRISAKDMSISLPADVETNDGSVVIGWTDGTTTYALDDVYTLETAGDKTLTAVVQEGTSAKPTSYNVSSIRLTDPTGIRFKASVTAAQKEAASEYGFVVARKAALTTAGVASADFTFESEVTKASGKCYVKGEIDKIFDTEGANIFFTAVLYNIPTSAYEDVIVARPYVKKGDLTVYGEPVEKSVYGVACDIRNADYAGLDAYGVEKVNEILAVVEG